MRRGGAAFIAGAPLAVLFACAALANEDHADVGLSPVMDFSPFGLSDFWFFVLLHAVAWAIAYGRKRQVLRAVILAFGLILPVFTVLWSLAFFLLESVPAPSMFSYVTAYFFIFPANVICLMLYAAFRLLRLRWPQVQAGLLAFTSTIGLALMYVMNYHVTNL